MLTLLKSLRPPLIALVILSSQGLQSAVPDDPLFASDEVLAITLHGPFEQIDDDRDKEMEYDGSLSYTDESGNEVTLTARYEVRGNWRLDPGNCSYSQLWVDLRRSELPDTLFANQNRLKLVVQCRRQDRYVEYLEKEMSAYRIFSLLSDYHFGIRPLQVTYVDTEEDETRTHTAFFIEHQNRLSDRYEMGEVEENRIEAAQLNPEQSVMVALFMYMLGNTDYSMIQGPPDDECCHNSKLLRADSGEYFPIPYDFDASGFVNASYAPEPNEGFRLRNNRDRLFRGFCVEEPILRSALQRFMELQPQIMATVSERRDVSFLEDFFETLTDERELEREILDECR